MENFRMRESYSFIGDNIDFLITNEQRIKNMMLDYEIESKVDTLEDGREVKSFLFTKNNTSVRFVPGRIEYSFSYTAANQFSSEAFANASDFFKLFSEIFEDFYAQRIAIVSQSFIKNENDSAVNEFCSKMGLIKAFGKTNELHLKINNPVTLFEPMNSVIDINMGSAKHNKTQEVMKVLLISVDVNTLAENTKARFNPKDFDLYFEDLSSEVELKQQALSGF